MAALYQSERCSQSVILKHLHRKFYHNLKRAAAQCYRQCIPVISNSAAAQCYRQCILVISNAVLFLCQQVAHIHPDSPAVWWRHWPEFSHRMPTVKTARTLRLCCVFRNSMEYSAAYDVLIVQVMYKLLNRPVQCPVQNAWHGLLTLWCSVLGGV